MSDPERKIRKIRFGLVGGLLFLLCLFALAIGDVIVQVPYFLITGWIGYFKRVVPQIDWDFESIAGGLFCLFATVTCLQLLLRRFSRDWKWKWTVIGSTLFLTLFAAGIAVTGVVHQAVWLVREDSVQSRPASYLRARNFNAMKQMGLGVMAWESDNDTYPATLRELYPDYIDVRPDEVIGLWSARRKDGAEREWLYFPEVFAIKDYPKSGSREFPAVLLASPFADGVRDVMFVDGRISKMSDQGFYDLIARQLRMLSDQQKSHSKP